MVTCSGDPKGMSGQALGVWEGVPEEGGRLGKKRVFCTSRRPGARVRRLPCGNRRAWVHSRAG